MSHENIIRAWKDTDFTYAGDEACNSGIIACTLLINCPVEQ
jgi:hypothetical protein